MEILFTDVFSRWLRRLRDRRAKASILVRLERIEDENFGDHRSVGQGVSELRIHIGRGYRVYYTIRQRAVVILLCGGDKSNQQEAISLAQQLAKEI